MDLIWMLTGGNYDGGEFKIYNLIEYDNIENNIKISNLNKRVFSIESPKINDTFIDEINKELDKGKKFLCKTDIYYNGNRLFNFGYYSKKNSEYKYTTFLNAKNKIIYKKLVSLLVENCILDLP